MAVLHMDRREGHLQKPTKTDQIILDYLDSEIKEYYDEDISQDSCFQVWYQLSSLRTGLLSWYPFRESGEILEIGAGFGGLTGLLCDKCARVTATERSAVRAEAIARRWDSKDNLHVYSGEWSEIEFGRKFDYIVITGILERAGKGSSDRAAYAEYLKKAAALLKEDGVLLVSADNRLGLKYFCGAGEAHLGKPFEGIAHYPNGTSGYSFSREELKVVIERAGLEARMFYYPLPDYKLPQLIYSDSYLPEQNLKERLIPYYLNHNSLIAAELDLYQDVVENGVFPFFANSFLVECGYKMACQQREETADEERRVIYAAVSTDRGRERGYATAIRKNGFVSKMPLFPEGEANARRLFENITDLEEHGIPVVKHKMLVDGSLELPFISWCTLSNYIKGIIKENQEEFLALIDRIYEYILISSDHAEPGENRLIENILDEEKRRNAEKLDFGPILKKAYMELIPLNCFYQPETKEFLYFDQEFVRENYPAKYVLFRALHYIYCFTPNAEQYYSRQKLEAKYGLTDTWEIYLAEEERFLDDVRNHKKYWQFYQWASVDQGRINKNVDRLLSEEEKIANYQISDKMKKIWKVELAMLDEVSRICKKHNLTWFLVHGSLLGAVRHKGFVPWDDDLDIAMPRKDYDLFLEIAEGELAEPLSIHTAETEKDMFWGGFARIRNSQTTGIEARELSHKGNLGIWIDILPLDVCTMDEGLFEKKEKRIRHCHRLILAKIYGKDYDRYGDMGKIQWGGYKLLSLFYSHNRLCRMLDGAMRLYTEEVSEDAAFFSGYYKHRRLNAKDFASTSKLEFEHRMLPVPAGYENYLFMSMGKDYMKYPPEEERKPKHTGIFDPEKPYGEYQRLLTGMFADMKGKRIVLFGSGMMFEDYMKKWGNRYRPEFLVDNDKNKWGRNRFGIPIKDPEELLKIPEGKLRLIICSFYYKEIQEQLEQMGIRDYRVYVQHLEWIVKSEQQ